MMHVLFVDRAGSKSIWDLMGHVARRLIECGGRATFVMWDDGHQSYSQEVPPGVDQILVRVPTKLRSLDLLRQHAVFAREFRTILRKLRPDVVHTNFAVPSIVARVIASQEKIPLIVSTQHELYESMRAHYRWGLRWTEGRCDAVAYVSNAVARSFGRAHRLAGSPKQAIRPWHVVIPNGADVLRIQSATRSVQTRVPGRIVCAGRMVPMKGQLLVVDALPSALRRHPHLSLRLIGSGPMESHLRQRVRENGVEQSVEFLGWQASDDVMREMAAAELVVVPSQYEGFGLVIAEAALCGTPVLASDIEAFREVLSGAGVEHRFFASNDLAALTSSLVEFPFSEPTADLRRAGDVSPVARLQSAADMAAAYLNVYRSLA